MPYLDWKVVCIGEAQDAHQCLCDAQLIQIPGPPQPTCVKNGLQRSILCILVSRGPQDPHGIQTVEMWHRRPENTQRPKRSGRSSQQH